MQAEVKYAFDQKVQLGAELQAVIDESFREIGQLYEIGSSLGAAGQAVESRVPAATTGLRGGGTAPPGSGTVPWGARRPGGRARRTPPDALPGRGSEAGRG